MQLDEKWNFKQKISARVHRKKTKSSSKICHVKALDDVKALEANVANEKRFPKNIGQYEFFYGYSN